MIDTNKYVLALHWSALDADKQTVLAGLQSNHPQSVDELTQAFVHYHSPMQSVVMADVQAVIRYKAAPLVLTARAVELARGLVGPRIWRCPPACPVRQARLPRRGGGHAGARWQLVMPVQQLCRADHGGVDAGVGPLAGRARYCPPHGAGARPTRRSACTGPSVMCRCWYAFLT